MATFLDTNKLTRRVNTPPAQHRRVKHETTDVSVPLDHDPEERLPLESHRAYGVGAKDDRLCIVDLDTGKINFLPSRASLLRATPDALNHAWYRYGGERSYTNLTAGKHTLGTNHLSICALDESEGAYGGVDSDTDPFGVFGRWGTMIGKAGVGYIPAGWSTANSHDMALAFVTNGMNSASAGSIQDDSGMSLRNFIHPHTMDDGADGSIDLQLARLVDGISADDLVASDPHLRRSLMYLYTMVPTTKSDVINGWSDTLMKLPRDMTYVENALHNLYSRNRSTKFPRAVGTHGTVPLMLSLMELGRAVRTGRPIQNIIPYSTLNAQSIDGDSALNTVDRPLRGPSGAQSSGVSGLLDGTPIRVNGELIEGGTVNALYQYLIAADGSEYLVAPAWLAPLLNFSTFENDVRDEEMQDIERSDLIQALNLVLSGAEVETALDLGSKKHVILSLFEKVADGEFKDFSDYTSPSVAMATSLLGYFSPRDITDKKAAPLGVGSAGRVPYFGGLLNTKGKLLGKEKRDFEDDLAEFSALSFKTADPTEFTKNLARTANWADTRMHMRTRFGDHAVTTKYYPGCFSKTSVIRTLYLESETTIGAATGAGTLDTGSNLDSLDDKIFGESDDGTTTSFYWPQLLGNSVTTAESARHLHFAITQVTILIPFYGWNMLDATTCSRGLIPRGMADNAVLDMRSMLRQSSTPVGSISHSSAHQALWTTDDWKLSTANTLYVRHQKLDDLYKEWEDRSSTIRNKDAGSLVTFSTVNLLGELTMNTPSAIVQRNMPSLVSMMQQPFAGATPDSSQDAVVLGGVHVVNDVVFGGLHRCHPFTMNVDRKLFDPNSDEQERNSGFDLLHPMLVNKAPEDIPGLYHALVYLACETDTFNGFPAIARAKFNNVASSTDGMMHNQELVVYQSRKDYQGKVTDLGCEFIVGGVRATADGSSPFSATSMVMLFTNSVAGQAAHYNRNQFSVWNWQPGPSESVSDDAADYGSPSASRIFLTTNLTTSTQQLTEKIRLPGTVGTYHIYDSFPAQASGSDHSELVICGENWRLKAYKSQIATLPPHVHMGTCELFGRNTPFLGLGLGNNVTRAGTDTLTEIDNAGGYPANTRTAMTCDGTDVLTNFKVGDEVYKMDGGDLRLIGILTAVTATSVTFGNGSLISVVDNNNLHMSPTVPHHTGQIVNGSSVQQQNLDTFMDKYGRYIEAVRTDLEWQHAADHLLFFDADMNDENEFLLNMALYGTGQGTRGPMTMYLVLDAMGTATESASIVGDLAIEIIDLSLGTSSEASGETEDVDDIGAEEANPGMEIVTVPDA